MDLQTLSDKLDTILAASKQVLTPNEAANYIGVSKNYLYKLTSKNRIPYYKPEGKQIYFDKDELNAWLCRNPQKTRSQIESEAIEFMAQNNFIVR